MKRKYGPLAGEKVEAAMHEMKRGKLKTSSGKTVTSPKQAVAIGLSQARKAGGKAWCQGLATPGYDQPPLRG